MNVCAERRRGGWDHVQCFCVCSCFRYVAVRFLSNVTDPSSTIMHKTIVMFTTDTNSQLNTMTNIHIHQITNGIGTSKTDIVKAPFPETPHPGEGAAEEVAPAFRKTCVFTNSRHDLR